ncbi:MAG: PAS domain S-box protein [Chloroflexota bacterium]|nr:PAS domain S-box protein [Chloroflexota bacterium]
MSEALRVVLIEQSSDDALMLIRELEHHDYAVTARVVDSAAALEAILDTFVPDLICTAYMMRGFDALMALAIIQRRQIDAPVMVVTGVVGEETAAAVMKAGAADFFLKSNLLRLAPAVARELRDADHRRQRRLVEAELLLKNRALEASPIGAMITDPNLPDNPIIYVNHAFEEMTGYRAAEIIGRNCRFLQGGDRDQPELEIVRVAIRQQRECQVVLRNYRKDGSLFWNQLQIAPLFASDGRLLYFVSAQSDITTKRANEEELRKLYSATSLLFRSSNLLDLGRAIAESVVSEFNYTDCRVIVPDESGERLLLLPSETGDDIKLSEMRLNGVGLIPLSLRTGQIVYAPDVSLHPDYVVGRVETRSELVVPLRMQNRVVGVLDLQSDHLDAFSDRDHRLLSAYAENAAAALEIATLIETINRHAAALEWRVFQRTDEFQRAKAQVETILESAGDVIVMLDAEGRMLQSNQAFERFFGRSRDLFEIRLFPDARLFVDPGAVAARITETVETDATIRHEFRCLHADGRIIDAEAVFAPLQSLIDGQHLVVCSIRDISTQKQLENSLRAALAQAKELDDLKADFVSMLSHEFRTPLAIILMSAQILQMHGEKMTLEARQERLNNIAIQVNHLTQLAEGVIMLGQAERVGMVFAPRPFDLIGFIGRQIEMLRLLASGRHTIVFTPTGCAPTMNGDDTLLRHILHNLVSNAIKYSPSGSDIHVDLDCSADALRLTVRDQGIGIPQEQQKRLFELFYRAENVGMIAGSGLGLAIVKMAVNAYGGTIAFESIEGAGTTFIVDLPGAP